MLYAAEIIDTSGHVVDILESATEGGAVTAGSEAVRGRDWLDYRVVPMHPDSVEDAGAAEILEESTEFQFGHDYEVVGGMSFIDGAVA